MEQFIYKTKAQTNDAKMKRHPEKNKAREIGIEGVYFLFLLVCLPIAHLLSQIFFEVGGWFQLLGVKTQFFFSVGGFIGTLSPFYELSLLICFIVIVIKKTSSDSKK